jgi:hypothetical protein
MENGVIGMDQPETWGLTKQTAVKAKRMIWINCNVATCCDTMPPTYIYMHYVGKKKYTS